MSSTLPVQAPTLSTQGQTSHARSSSPVASCSSSAQDPSASSLQSNSESCSSSSRSPSPVKSTSSSTDFSSSTDVVTSETTDDSVSTGRSSSQRTTYKLVGDNIDKNIRPREMRSDYQTRSLHYFHTYAVCDRVDMSNFSEEVPLVTMNSIALQDLLPTSSDECMMRDNFVVLVGRTLAKNMPFFSKFCKGQRRHISHEFSKEMAQKSEVVGFTFNVCCQPHLCMCTHAFKLYVYVL